MRRLLIPLLLATVTFAGCGQKGPLVLPPARPQVAHPAPATSAAPASASSTAAPAAASSGA